MAARSPIVLDSPSPTVPEYSPITPQHHRKSSTVDTSSSPALLSISKLVRRRNPGLISGSRAQELPQNTEAGFASAASLWDAQTSEAGTKTAQQQDQHTTILHNAAKETSTTRNNAGKLPKRRKTDETGETTREASITAQISLSTIAYQDENERRDSMSASPAPARRPNADLQDPRQARAPSISLSEYDFRPEEHTAREAQILPIEPVKKPRRPRAETDEANAGAVAKKPRKRTARTAKTGEDAKKRSRHPLKKSESLILNSDDLAATQADTYSRIEIPSPPKARKTKKTTLKTAPNPNEEGASTTLAAPKETSTKSAYFGELPRQQDEAMAKDTGSTDDVLDLTEFPREATPKSPALPQIAPRRRLSWTPAKKPVTKTLRGDESALDPKSDDEKTTTKSFAQLVSGLGYASGPSYVQPTAGQRSASGEALTKRRRINLADEATKAPTRRRASPEPAPVEKPKKAKALKKKPQTITDLATKAYRAPQEEATAQPTVSEFFSAQKADTVPIAETDIDGATVKPKKPRKPRTKKCEGEGSKSESALKTAKSKKVKKVKIAEESHLANLHTPRQARAHEQSQDFLFGTSSQLGVEDSPTFIRDMQMAVQESEAVPASQIDSLKSRARVPNAPESGTNLSITQANRDLWCTAARDIDGDVMRLDSATIRIVQARERLLVPKAVAVVPAPSEQAKDDSDEVPTNALPLPDTPQDDEAPKPAVQPPQLNKESPAAPEENVQREIVDLCDTSPIAEDDDAALPVLADPSQSKISHSPRATVTATTEAETDEPQSEEIWAIIPSDSSPREQSDVPPLPRATGLHSPSKHFSKAIPQLKRSATSPIRQRLALQDLDANISSLHHTSPGKGPETVQQRALVNSSVSDLLKRPRGRPKNSAAVEISPRKRGRLPKTDTLAAVPEPQRWKKADLGVSASQPVASGSSEFANIDEISDPDSQTTPSPPRRRAMSSPPEVQTLDFDIAESPSKMKALRTAIVTLKPGDDYFVTTIQPSLFPQITKTVKSTPPSNSLTNPSWHEKILLYDPIVLEDFTAWLNEQGLTIELQRLKPKSKTKGKKNKDAVPVPDEAEYETVKEELKPWMVQKWCEEKSVCCLWKEGLRGGVRTRY